ncbi:hypothetical protein RFI_30553, partial [Reticulomyxa filosa]
LHQATISGSKSDKELDEKSTVFPDLMWASDNKMNGKSELENPFIVIDYKIPVKLEIFDNNKDELDKIWTNGFIDIDSIIEENTRNNSKNTKTYIEASLVNPILQIAGYMIWNGAKVVMIIGYPRFFWFEVDSVDPNGKFTINVYSMLKMNSFEDAMPELVRITKYAKTLSPNKKYFSEKNNNIEGDKKIKDEIEDEDEDEHEDEHEDEEEQYDEKILTRKHTKKINFSNKSKHLHAVSQAKIE